MLGPGHVLNNRRYIFHFAVVAVAAAMLALSATIYDMTAQETRAAISREIPVVTTVSAPLALLPPQPLLAWVPPASSATAGAGGGLPCRAHRS